ncbi:hypothetical protein TrLO_g12736 [Triparma laevis f. longispina]|uniref:Uncharacterized protein n=1 Tax=Triparma laevis f. longispina TaxID=1714387 RepID=A0A9W7DP80_9STRA|nr:hypothetical protein TrLO_g12736 [Triparma laevis f. longispina]
MKNPEAYQIDEKSQQEKGLYYLSSFYANYAPASLINESKMRTKEHTEGFVSLREILTLYRRRGGEKSSASSFHL